MVFSLLLGACDHDDDYVSYSIDLKDTPDQYEYLDENGELEIPLYIASETGIKSAYYKVGGKNDEGKVMIGNAVDIPVPEKSSNDVLLVKIPVIKNMSHIFFAVFDKNDQLYKRTVTVAEVKEIMDEAISHSQKANVKHLARRVFGKGTDDSDRIILKEEDFRI